MEIRYVLNPSVDPEGQRSVPKRWTAGLVILFSIQCCSKT